MLGALQSFVSHDKEARETTAEALGDNFGVSKMTTLRALKKLSYHSVKPTFKPGLTQAMRDARLAFAIAHKDWTLEDWMRVIWTDETSVILGHRRGRLRVWKMPKEIMEDSVIRRRFKKYAMFMVWGCFTYHLKGPMHIFQTETAAERRSAQEFLDQLNAQREPHFKQKWEAAIALQHMSRNGRRHGRAREWKFNKANGALVREAKGGGIDWFTYLEQVLIGKLQPFIEDCKREGLNPMVVEDGAGPHAHSAQNTFYSFFQISRLLWPGNSPDLNAIEPCWMWMKKETTKNGPPRTREEAEERWNNAWEALPQAMIKRWVARIPEAIKEIIALKGGNEYIESTHRRQHQRRRVGANQRAESNAVAEDRTAEASDDDHEHGDVADETEEENGTELDDLLSLFDDSEDDSEVNEGAFGSDDMGNDFDGMEAMDDENDSLDDEE